MLALSTGTAYAAESDDSSPAILNTIQNFEISAGETAKLYLHTKFTDDGAMTYAVDAADSAIVSVRTDGSRVAMTGLAAGTTQVTACASDGTNDATCQTFRVTVQPSATPVKISNTIQNFEILNGETAKLYLHTKFSGQGDLEYTADAADSTIVSIQTDKGRVAMTGLAAGSTQVTACASDGTGEPLCQRYTVTVAAGSVLLPPPDLTAEATGMLTAIDIGTARIEGGNSRITSDAPDSFPLGDTVVTWSADGHGDVAQTVTIRDTTPPKFGVLRDIKVGVSPERPLLFYNTPDASDLADDSVDVSCIPERETAVTLGTVSVTCTATDDSGNSSTGSFDVTMVPFDDGLTPDTIQYDLNAPIITAPDDITAEATGVLTAVDIGTATAKDADGDFPTVSSNAPDSYPLGDTVVTWTAVNSGGYVARAHQSITVQDTTPPSFDVVPEDVKLESQNGTASLYYDTPTVTDLVDGRPGVTCEPAAGTQLPAGTTKITCTATDNAGNSGMVSFDATVITGDDSAAPPTKVAYNPMSMITATIPFQNSYLGSSIDIDGNTMVVGAYGHIHDSPEDGAAYVFTRTADGWSEPVKLTADEGFWFGRTVAIHGDTIVAGTRNSDGGAVHVFTRDNNVWVQSDTLLINGTASVYFGRSVDIYEDTIVVGADVIHASDTSPGSAYIFTRTADGWSESQKIAANDGSRGDHFGWDVAIDQKTIIVGSFKNALYVFDVNDGVWSQTQKITSVDSEHRDYFGKSAAIHNDTMVVGAAGDDDMGSNSGSAYVFTRNDATNSWEEVSKLQPDDGARLDYFGNSVSVYDDTVIAGSVFHGAGAAYVFKNGDNAWEFDSKLTVDDGRKHNWFGYEVRAYQDTLLVGSILTDGQLEGELVYNSGAVYEYNPP